MTRDRRLQGKVAIVTGAASNIGLGRAMTLALVRSGARVAMVDVDGPGLSERRREMEEEAGAGCVAAVLADVSDPAQAERAVQETISGLGGLHILVNNAGINPRFESFWEMTPQAWSRTIAVNLNGPCFMARAAIGAMRSQGWGRIIGITTSLDTMLGSAPYGPSKAGHEALVAVMARHLEGSGVTANVLLPGGAADTNMIPPGRDRSRLLRPEIMQGPVVWLASEESNGFNGRRIVAEFWDEALPIEQRLEKASAPAAWPQLGRQQRP